jgi:plastocyanin
VRLHEPNSSRGATIRSFATAVFALLAAASVSAAATHRVTASGTGMDSKFEPATLTIQVGDTVEWVNVEGVHNVVSDDDLFDSGFVAPPEADTWPFSFTFNSGGTYRYYCTIHGNKNGVGQSGIIFVRPVHAASEIVYEKSAWDFSPGSAGIQAGEGPEELMRSISATAGGNELRAGVQLPAGSKITGIEITGCDDNASADMEAGLVECPDPTGACTLIVKAETTGQPGCGFFDTAVAAGPTVNNLANSYALLIQLPATDTSLRFRNVRLFYKRQVSPAPATATFGDVPTTHAFFRVIEALAASGITQGCGNGNYCPDDPVTRAAMAKFLTQALGMFFPN